MATQVRWRDPRPQLPRSCYTAQGYPKLRYEHRWQAKQAARALAKKGKGECHAYLCPYCKYFHIGSDK